jgi:hypothetical protein
MKKSYFNYQFILTYAICLGCIISCSGPKHYTSTRHFVTSLKEQKDLEISTSVVNFKIGSIGAAFSPIDKLGIFYNYQKGQLPNEGFFGGGKNQDSKGYEIGVGHYSPMYNYSSYISFSDNLHYFDENEGCFIFCNWDSNLAVKYKSKAYSWLSSYNVKSDDKNASLTFHYKMKYLQFYNIEIKSNFSEVQNHLASRKNNLMNEVGCSFVFGNEIKFIGQAFAIINPNHQDLNYEKYSISFSAQFSLSEAVMSIKPKKIRK